VVRVTSGRLNSPPKADTQAVEDEFDDTGIKMLFSELSGLELDPCVEGKL